MNLEKENKVLRSENAILRRNIAWLQKRAENTRNDKKEEMQGIIDSQNEFIAALLSRDAEELEPLIDICGKQHKTEL
jgi:DUF438 domain-containing protein